MARPSKLTDEVQATICDSLSDGNSVVVATALAGVSERVYYKWQARGEAAIEAADEGQTPDEAEQRYVQFVQAVTRARAEAEQQRVENIRVAGEEDWRASAWLLERTYPERYGRVMRQKLEHSGPGGGPIRTAGVNLETDDPAELQQMYQELFSEEE